VIPDRRPDEPDRLVRRRGPLRRVTEHRLYNEWLWAYVFLLPALAIFAIFLVYPAIQSVIYSFDIFNPLQGDRRFVGLGNYVTLFRDPVWWTAIANTLIFTIATVPVAIAVSLGIALLLMPLHSRLQTVFKTIFYMPGVTSAVVIGLVWLWIFYPFSEGLANFVVESLGFERVNWLGKGTTALPSIIVMTWLTGMGAAIVLYMAALGNIPSSIYEAADIDCAGRWSKLWGITIPLMSPVIFFNLIMGVIGSFQVFTAGFLLTDGGPQNSTLFYTLYIYRNAFRYFDMGYAAALAWVLFFIILALTLLIVKYLGGRVHYEEPR